MNLFKEIDSLSYAVGFGFLVFLFGVIINTIVKFFIAISKKVKGKKVDSFEIAEGWHFMWRFTLACGAVFLVFSLVLIICNWFSYANEAIGKVLYEEQSGTLVKNCNFYKGVTFEVSSMGELESITIDGSEAIDGSEVNLDEKEKGRWSNENYN